MTNILSRKSRKFSKFRLWTDFSCTLFKICHVRNSGETWAETYLQRLPHWQPNVSRPQDFPGRTNRNLLRELKEKKSKYGQAFKSKARRSSKHLDQPDLKTTRTERSQNESCDVSPKNLVQIDEKLFPIKVNMIWRWGNRGMGEFGRILEINPRLRLGSAQLSRNLTAPLRLEKV